LAFNQESSVLYSGEKEYFDYLQLHQLPPFIRIVNRASEITLNKNFFFLTKIRIISSELKVTSPHSISEAQDDTTVTFDDELIHHKQKFKLSTNYTHGMV